MPGDLRDPPAAWLPPQTWYGELWRIVVCLGMSALAWSQLIRAQLDQNPLLFAVDLTAGVIAYLLVFFRRRWPLPIAIAVTALGIVSASAVGPAVLVAVSVATRRRIGQIVAVGILGVIAGWLYSVIEPRVSNDPRWLDLSFNVVFTVAFLAIGMYIGSRRELIWSLRVRAEDAEREQDLRLEQARARERERIAREMHDVLAHRISLITMHAGALAFRDDLPPDQVRETADLIAKTSHEALGDLREVLGTLRQPEGVRPQPTLAALPDLVAEATANGMDVDLTVSLSGPDEVPDRLARTVFRMVQEALTNARKHAPGVPVAVGLSGGAGTGVSVRVRNGVNRFRSTNATGSGLGLIGMRERFELLGGHLDVDDSSRWFVLEGWLPWPK